MRSFSFINTIFLLSISANTYAGEYCGSKTGYLNQITSTFLIPDYFPPEAPALRDLVSDADYERCQRLAMVPLGSACQQHDLCYEQKLGKESCDRALQDSWVKQCRASYYKFTIDNYACRLACEAFVKLMSEAQRYDSGGFCPSCEAYNTSNSGE